MVSSSSLRAPYAYFASKQGSCGGGIPFYGGDFDIYTAKAESVQNYSWYDQSGQGQIAGQGGEIHFFFIFPPSECIRKGGRGEFVMRRNSFFLPPRSPLPPKMEGGGKPFCVRNKPFPKCMTRGGSGSR